MDKENYNIEDDRLHGLYLLSRYETTQSNEFYRALNELQKIQYLRTARGK